MKVVPAPGLRVTQNMAPRQEASGHPGTDRAASTTDPCARGKNRTPGANQQYQPATATKRTAARAKLALLVKGAAVEAATKKPPRRVAFNSSVAALPRLPDCIDELCESIRSGDADQHQRRWTSRLR